MKKKQNFRLSSILAARCPSCHKGKITTGFFTIRPKCPECNYNFHPEPGFYLGAMVVGFLLTAIVTVPPLIALKVMDVDPTLLFVFPFIEFLFLGTFLLLYCRILWLHMEYQLTGRLDGNNKKNSS